MKAQPGNQREAGQQRAGDRASGVGGVNQPQICRPVSSRRVATATANGNAAPNAMVIGASSPMTSSAWRVQHRRVSHVGPREDCGDVEQRAIDERSGQCGTPDRERETQGERRGGLSHAWHEARGDCRADRDSGDEDRHDRAERVGGRSENQRQHAGPDHLKHERCESRDRERGGGNRTG